MEIIFDTNAYRQLAYGKTIDTLRRDMAAITGVEERLGFRVFMSPVPWLELYSHLANEDDPGFNNCLFAVVASYNHTRRDSRAGDPMLIHRPDMLKANTLFGYIDEGENRILWNLDWLSDAINKDPSSSTIKMHQSYIKDLRSFNKDREEEYLILFESVQEVYYSMLEDKSVGKQMQQRSFFDRWLNLSLLDTANFSNTDLDGYGPKKIESLKKIIEDYFSTPFYLGRNILTSMVGDQAFNIRKKHRENWYWDYQMLIYISKMNQNILVTSDQDMWRAAEAAGLSSRIMSLEEYLKLLSLNITIG